MPMKPEHEISAIVVGICVATGGAILLIALMFNGVI